MKKLKCKRCGKEKPECFFNFGKSPSFDARVIQGRSPYCVECRKAREREKWRKKNPKQKPYQRTEKYCLGCKKMVPILNFPKYFVDNFTRMERREECRECWKTRIDNLTLKYSPHKRVSNERSW